MKRTDLVRRRGAWVLAACLVAGGSDVLAHHSFSAQYDSERSETVEGIVTNVAWRNPHVYFFMDVVDEKGGVIPWSFELSNVSAMRNQGWSRETLQVGDRLEVTGFRARDGSHLLNARTIFRIGDATPLLGEREDTAP